MYVRTEPWITAVALCESTVCTAVVPRLSSPNIIFHILGHLCYVNIYIPENNEAVGSLMDIIPVLPIAIQISCDILKNIRNFLQYFKILCIYSTIFGKNDNDVLQNPDLQTVK
jgi:hypothetical protein